MFPKQKIYIFYYIIPVFSMNIFVKTLYWSKNVMPEAGEYPQSIINKQILDKSDAIIAIFGNRIGSPTQK